MFSSMYYMYYVPCRHCNTDREGHFGCSRKTVWMLFMEEIESEEKVKMSFFYMPNMDEETEDDSHEIPASEGIVYFTLSSSTGTKLYDLAEEEYDYTALSIQNYRPQMTRVDVTDTSFDITVYYEDEDGSVKVLDDYRIIE